MTVFNPAATILIIDDEPVVRESMLVYLSDSGYSVHAAADGMRALAMFRELRPDLVICDLRMPQIDGIELLRTINSESPETPVIVVSGQGSMLDVVAALRLGASDYLVKPLVDMEMLEHAVRRALERGQLLRENRLYREQLELTCNELEHSLNVLEEDQEAGRRVQMKMLPPTPFEMSGCCIHHHIVPSLYLSGDFVDYFRLSDNRVLFYLADVSGHGASSAFITIFLKTITNRMQREGRASSPAMILEQINRELLELELGKHLVMFCGLIDTARSTLIYSSGAQFPPPLLHSMGRSGLLETDGLPVGLFPDARFEDREVELSADFALMLMSDGILELMPQESLKEKEEALFDVFDKGARSLEQFNKAFGLQEMQDVPDDIALLVIEGVPA